MQHFRARRDKLRKTNVKLHLSIFYVFNLTFANFERRVIFFIVVYFSLDVVQPGMISRVCWQMFFQHTGKSEIYAQVAAAESDVLQCCVGPDSDKKGNRKVQKKYIRKIYVFVYLSYQFSHMFSYMFCTFHHRCLQSQSVAVTGQDNSSVKARLLLCLSMCFQLLPVFYFWHLPQPQPMSSSAKSWIVPSCFMYFQRLPVFYVQRLPEPNPISSSAKSGICFPLLLLSSSSLPPLPLLF